MARKMYREAIDNYTRATRVGCDLEQDRHAWHSLAICRWRAKSYEKSIKLDKKYADAVNNLGAVYYAERNTRPPSPAIKRQLSCLEFCLVPQQSGNRLVCRGKYD